MKIFMLASLIMSIGSSFMFPAKVSARSPMESSTVFRTPINGPMRALTPPTTFDYSFTRDSTGTNRYWHTTRVSDNQRFNAQFIYSMDTTYHDFYGSFGVNQYLPFTVAMEFNRSESDWTLMPNNVAVPSILSTNTAYIGGAEDTGEALKFTLTFDNQTSHKYVLWLDLSSSDTYTIGNYDLGAGVDTSNMPTVFFEDQLNRFVIPAYTPLFLRVGQLGLDQFFDAFYLKDLGVDSTYTAGYDDGIDYDYFTRYGEGYDAGVIIGHATGYNDGVDAGYETGYTAGLADNSAYEVGYADGGRDSFEANLDKWIVPAIIVVIIAGGAFTIMTWKKKQAE